MPGPASSPGALLLLLLLLLQTEAIPQRGERLRAPLAVPWADDAIDVGAILAVGGFARPGLETSKGFGPLRLGARSFPKSLATWRTMAAIWLICRWVRSTRSFPFFCRSSCFKLLPFSELCRFQFFNCFVELCRFQCFNYVVAHFAVFYCCYSYYYYYYYCQVSITLLRLLLLLLLELGACKFPFFSRPCYLLGPCRR